MKPPRNDFFSAALVAVLAAVPVPAATAQSIETLLGSWSGVGHVDLQAGKSEKIRCNAYNTLSGNELRLVIRCASTSYMIEVRSRLEQEGSRLTGQWEERTYNATGTATGSVGGGTLTLAIHGGGFSGSMDVRFTAKRLTVNIATTGIDMRSLVMVLDKSGA